ncbi:MAG: hypothetical protein ABIG93_01660 [archaeon]|nr:hypothetical protein [Nanoarchaeota archaeon]
MVGHTTSPVVQDPFAELAARHSKRYQEAYQNTTKIVGIPRDLTIEEPIFTGDRNYVATLSTSERDYQIRNKTTKYIGPLPDMKPGLLEEALLIAASELGIKVTLLTRPGELCEEKFLEVFDAKFNDPYSTEFSGTEHCGIIHGLVKESSPESGTTYAAYLHNGIQMIPILGKIAGESQHEEWALDTRPHGHHILVSPNPFLLSERSDLENLEAAYKTGSTVIVTGGIELETVGDRACKDFFDGVRAMDYIRIRQVRLLDS